LGMAGVVQGTWGRFNSQKFLCRSNPDTRLQKPSPSGKSIYDPENLRGCNRGGNDALGGAHRKAPVRSSLYISRLRPERSAGLVQVMRGAVMANLSGPASAWGCREHLKCKKICKKQDHHTQTKRSFSRPNRKTVVAPTRAGMERRPWAFNSWGHA